MTPNKLPPANEYHISFNTKDSAGYIKAVKVSISEDVVLLDETVRIDLVDHPLYPALQKYILQNLKRGR